MTALAPLHGGQIRQIAQRFGVPSSVLLDFSANVNPQGPPSAVITALRQALDEPSTFMNYPDLEEADLRQALARYAGVQAENMAVANGFVPLLESTLHILRIRKCLVPVPAFIEYRRTLERSRVEMIPHFLANESDFRVDPDCVFRKPCDAILLANPQNPSAVLSSRNILLQIVESAAKLGVHVLLDEAFIDFCPEASLAKDIERFSNLIVFRSVTKFFGMAGLRVAYALANPGICTRMQDAVAPWSISSLASLAATVAVQDEPYSRDTISRNGVRRNALEAAIQKLGIHVYPSAANFLLLRLPSSIESQQIWESLIRNHRIVLRNCANYEGLSGGHLRAAVRTDDDNRQLIEALAFELGQTR
jgi:threonine-phosphate decarboxylase